MRSVLALAACAAIAAADPSSAGAQGRELDSPTSARTARRAAPPARAAPPTPPPVVVDDPGDEEEGATTAPAETAPADPGPPRVYPDPPELAPVEVFDQEVYDDDAPPPRAQTPPLATADARCAEGRVAGVATSGRCCWPGQVWAEDLGRCRGPPRCPRGLVSHGDECVGRCDAAPPVPAQARTRSAR
jgi:hypothetical protein